MKRLLPIILLALVSCLQFSCSQLQQQQEKQEEPIKEEITAAIPPPLYLGTVHQIFPADKFALLRIIGPVPKEGTVLITHPADGTTERVGNLIVSSAQHARGNIIAADIRAGLVMKGDRIFLYRSITAEAEETEEPEPFTLTDTEIDVGYTPPEIKEKLQQVSTTTAPAPEPATGLTETPFENTHTETESSIPEPIPSTPAIQSTPGKFDDIPDTLDGWDSM